MATTRRRSRPWCSSPSTWRSEGRRLVVLAAPGRSPRRGCAPDRPPLRRQASTTTSAAATTTPRGRGPDEIPKHAAGGADRGRRRRTSGSSSSSTSRTAVQPWSCRLARPGDLLLVFADAIQSQLEADHPASRPTPRTRRAGERLARRATLVEPSGIHRPGPRSWRRPAGLRARRPGRSSGTGRGG